ncbi:FAD-dependent oxidoreductase, partial [Akkermansia muciniphila]
KGEVSGITLQDLITGEERELPVKAVFMAIGHTPNSKFLGDLVDIDAQGFIVRQGGTTATKTPGLFAAGDVADPLY